MVLYHLGKNVFYFSGLGSDYYGYGEGQKQLVNKLSKFLLTIKNYRYSFCVTANKFQGFLHKTLLKNGYKKCFDFYSSHCDSKETNETLTLFVRINKHFTYTKKDAEKPNNYNCTINVGSFSKYYVANIVVLNSIYNLSWLKKNNFQRVRRSPIFIKIKESHFIKKH